jgi:hypothetical protein
MIRHLLFYCAEATLITAALGLALWLVASALRRIGIAIRVRWTVLVALWIGIACLDTLLSEAIGPEFTQLDLFAFWSLMAAAALWLGVVVRAALGSVRNRLAAREEQP